MNKELKALNKAKIVNFMSFNLGILTLGRGQHCYVMLLRQTGNKPQTFICTQ